MSEPNADDVLAAALIQLASQAEQIANLGGRADALNTRFDAVTTILGRHAAVINEIDGIDEQVAAITRQLAELAATTGTTSQDAYEPAPAPRWWQLRSDERSNATHRLQAWVKQVYRPGYGHLSAALPGCWERHPLCLYTLDWLSELWSALYLTTSRSQGTLAAQAEWQTRLLPAAANQMARDAAGCDHLSGQFRHPPPPAGRP
jgi:hypothetical protein